MTVEIKEIKQGANINGMTVIEEGLKPGETVVTDGHLRLVPGAKIIVKNDNIAGGDLKK
jgi:multidrug efflux system membrane fusion protein